MIENLISFYMEYGQENVQKNWHCNMFLLSIRTSYQNNLAVLFNNSSYNKYYGRLRLFFCATTYFTCTSCLYICKIKSYWQNTYMYLHIDDDLNSYRYHKNREIILVCLIICYSFINIINFSSFQNVYDLFCIV